LTAQVTGLARHSPVLLLLEDAHWIDPSTLESLALTVEAIRNARVLVLITYRPEFKAQWTGEAHVSHVLLNRLSARQTRALAEHVAGERALPEEIVGQIVQKTDGIPLFVEELTKAVLESGLLELDAGTNGYKLKGPLSAIAIPATLRDSLTARLDRLSPTKEVAQIGACIGREFGYALLEKVANLPEAQLTEALARLVDSELVFQRGEPPEASYTFKHALIQDAAYEGLLKSRRAQLHARIARALDQHFPRLASSNPEIVARHLTESGSVAAAAPFWASACELALRRFALTESVEHADRAIRATLAQPASPQRDQLELRVRLSGGLAHMALKGWAHPDVRDFYAPAVPLARTLQRESEVTPLFWALSMNDLVGARIPQATAWVSQAIEAATRTDSDEMRIIANMAGLVVKFFAGDLGAASRHGDEVLRIYGLRDWAHIVRNYNHDPRTLWGIYAAQWTWLLGYPDRAAAIVRDNETFARQLGHPFDYGFAVGFGSSIYHFLGDVSALLDRSLECERVGTEHGIPFMAVYQKRIPRGLARTGSPKENVAMIREYIAGAEFIGSFIMNLYWQALLAQELALDGALDEAADVVACASREAENSGKWDRVYRPEIFRIHARIQSMQGYRDGAERILRSAIADAQSMEARSWELRATMDLARLLRMDGRESEGRDCLRSVYDWFTEGRDTKDHVEARALLEELGG
jgi:hypothetical protein